MTALKKPHEETWYREGTTHIYAPGREGMPVGEMFGGRAQLATAAPDLARACEEFCQAVEGMAVPLRSDVQLVYRNALAALRKAGVR